MKFKTKHVRLRFFATFFSHDKYFKTEYLNKNKNKEKKNEKMAKICFFDGKKRRNFHGKKSIFHSFILEIKKNFERKKSIFHTFILRPITILLLLNIYISK